MPVMVIADRIGWTRSIRMLSARVAELGPVCWPPDPASRMSYVAREIAQCDLWFPPIGLPVGFGQVRKPTQLPVLTMVTGYARWLLALLIPSRRVEDLKRSSRATSGRITAGGALIDLGDLVAFWLLQRPQPIQIGAVLSVLGVAPGLRTSACHLGPFAGRQ